MEIKEISRRCELVDGVGMACGPVFYTAIEAEMVVQDGEDIRYLEASWVDEVPDAISFEVNTESIFDLMVSGEDHDRLESIRLLSSETLEEDIAERYKNQCFELFEMVKTKLRDAELYDEEDLEEFFEEW